jgi:hypothetical protein
MPTPNGQLRARHRPRILIRADLLAALAPGLVLTLALAACGGSGPASAAAVHQACQQIGAVLSDGPDPDADPAGYAEAQILPLRQVHAPDQAIKSAISQLDKAYQQLFASDGNSAAATRAVAAASKKMNSICPGAAS